MYRDSICCWEQRCRVFQDFTGTSNGQCLKFLLGPEMYFVSRICCEERCTVSQVVAGTTDVKFLK